MSIGFSDKILSDIFIYKCICNVLKLLFVRNLSEICTQVESVLNACRMLRCFPATLNQYCGSLCEYVSEPGGSPDILVNRSKSWFAFSLLCVVSVLQLASVAM